MAGEIFMRALLAALIALAGVGLYLLINRVILARARGRRLGLESLRPGIPAILYFTTPFCAPCKTVQRPALARVQERLGRDGMQVIEVDASARPDLADCWGVLSVPTTFIVDSKGRPRRVNHGVAGADKLIRQIEEVEQKPTPARVFKGALRWLQERASR
jgi:thiol-disulfide isomerase/thioredoxin